MGLFGMFKGKEPAAPQQLKEPAEYLDTVKDPGSLKDKVWKLLSDPQKGFCIYIDPQNQDSVLAIQDHLTLEDCAFFTDEIRKLPSDLKMSPISFETVLEKTIKGGMYTDTMEFYLALMYEHGMLSETVDPYMHISPSDLPNYRNQEMADKYHTICLNKHNPLELAYKHLTERYEGTEGPYDFLEHLAERMAYCCGSQETNEQKDMAEILGYYASEFMTFGGLLMAFYASKGFPKCSAALVKYMSVAINHASGKTPMFFDMFRYMQPQKAEVWAAALDSIIAPVLAAARNGDEAALTAIQNYGFTHLL